MLAPSWALSCSRTMALTSSAVICRPPHPSVSRVTIHPTFPTPTTNSTAEARKRPPRAPTRRRTRRATVADAAAPSTRGKGVRSSAAARAESVAAAPVRSSATSASGRGGAPGSSPRTSRARACRVDHVCATPARTGTPRSCFHRARDTQAGERRLLALLDRLAAGLAERGAIATALALVVAPAASRAACPVAIPVVGYVAHLRSLHAFHSRLRDP